jgi:hypothetical protein
MESGSAPEQDFQCVFQTRIAGEVAEELVCGQEWDLGGTDADGVLAALNDVWSCSTTKISSPQDMDEYLKAVEEYKSKWADSMAEDAKIKLSSHIPAIRAIADKLIQRKTISGRLARKLFSVHSLNGPS